MFVSIWSPLSRHGRLRPAGPRASSSRYLHVARLGKRGRQVRCCSPTSGWTEDVDGVFDTVNTLYGDKEDEYAPVYRLMSARDEQSNMGLLGKSFITYGEYDLLLFTRLLLAARPRPGEVFYDLGSGVGRLVIAASLLYPHWSACKGIEMLPNLHEQGLEFLSQHRDRKQTAGQGPQISLSCGDFENADLSEADVVFCYSTTWPALGNTLTMVSRKLGEDLKFGARCITADKTLAEDAGPGVGFELRDTIEGINKDTGDSCGYVYVKVPR